MKVWRKDFGRHYNSDREFLFITLSILIIIGLFFREPILYVITGVFLVYFVINILYDRSIGNNLYIGNKRETIKLFQGEKDKLAFELTNMSFIPMIHGQFRFQTKSILKPLDVNESSDQTMQVFRKNLTIGAKGKTSIEFPFAAKERGVAKIRNISYTSPHLFNFNILTISYTPAYYTEIIVFPEPLIVKGLEEAMQIVPGDYKKNFSPFEEIVSPTGTRNYEYSDPFHRINWKASVKMQQLQSNVYEKVTDMSYLFIVNVRYLQNGKQVNEEMEKILSYTAYLCQQAMKADVPYELYINARTAKSLPYFNLPEGEGVSHYIRSLEMLARVPRHTMIYPFANMLYQARSKVAFSKTIVIIGQVAEEAYYSLNDWNRMNKNIFHVVPYGDVAVLKRWHKGEKLHA